MEWETVIFPYFFFLLSHFFWFIFSMQLFSFNFFLFDKFKANIHSIQFQIYLSWFQIENNFGFYCIKFEYVSFSIVFFFFLSSNERKDAFLLILFLYSKRHEFKIEKVKTKRKKKKISSFGCFFHMNAVRICACLLHTMNTHTHNKIKWEILR